jgi:radical SAM superfamily enzyme YgiQ (UPF0313 family)
MAINGNRKKTRVGLVQVNNSFSGQHYLPLSVGVFQAYAQRYLSQPDCYEFLLPLFRRIPVEEALAQLQGVDVALFSTYVWNYRMSLEIARRLKDEQPEAVIAFGGPQVPDNAEGFLREHPFIDLACHGEGELTSLAILENWASREWGAVPGITYLDQGGRLLRNPKAPRLKDLASTPSPYLEGVFSPLMEANPDAKWIAMWESNRGCPFSCSFCDWGSAVQAKVYTFDMERLFREIEWFGIHKIDFVWCCDANFGILPRDIDLASHFVEIKKKYGFPGALTVQNTKNATERAYQVQKILSDGGLNKGVDLALQSLDPGALKSVKRANISSETYQELQRRFTRDKVETYTDLIAPLPGETYDSFANGVSTIIQNGQHNRIQFNNLSILPNAEMGDPGYRKKHGMITVETKIINMHGSLIESTWDIDETQVLVIATDTMPKEDWIKTRVFSWMCALLIFDKTLQIPLLLTHELCLVSHRDLIEEFLQASPESFPILAEIQAYFTRRATSIQNGGPEYAPAAPWLNIWWPDDEYVLIKLAAENKLDQFYQEAEELITRLLQDRNLRLPEDLLHQAVGLNRALLKQPFQTEDLDVTLSFNIWEFYQSILTGMDLALERRESRYHVDRTSKSWQSFDTWCQEVIWYGNKGGAYLYGNDNVVPQLAGHY